MIWGVIVALRAACPELWKPRSCTRFIALGAIEVCTVPVAIQITSALPHKRRTSRSCGTVVYDVRLGRRIRRLLLLGASTMPKSFRWQGLFILYGGMTFVTGLAMFFLLAASPTEDKWLTEEEKVIALERVRQKQDGY